MRLLDPFPVERILSSPYLRCVQTVAPLAKARGLKVETAAELAEGSGASPFWDLAARLGPQPSILCSHGDVIAAVLSGLSRAGLIENADLMAEKGSVWVLEGEGGAVASARRIPAPQGRKPQRG